jgi:hypothetical protein
MVKFISRKMDQTPAVRTFEATLMPEGRHLGPEEVSTAWRR